MKDIILAIQEKLNSQVADLKYIDKDWGQLDYDQPPVKYPFCLIDITDIQYSNIAKGLQLASGEVLLVVGVQHLTPSSAQAPNKENSHEAVDILKKINDVLHTWSNGNFSNLIRTRTKKLYKSKGLDIYCAFYSTQWKETIPSTTAAFNPEGIKISVG